MCFARAVGLSLRSQVIGQRRPRKSTSQRRAPVRRAERNVVAVAPEADLVTRLDPQFIAQILRDHDLALRSDPVSHTVEYNHS